MDAVGSYSLGAENAVAVEALDNAAAVIALALGHIRRSLGHMYVEACTELRGRAGTLRECAVSDGERGVETEESAEHAVTRLLARREKCAILFDTLERDLDAIAIGDFVAKTTTQAGEMSGVCNAEEAAFHRIGTGMVVEDGGCAVANAVDHGDGGAERDIVEGEDFVEAPPEAFEDFDEVAGGSIFERHSAGEGAVEVHVGVDEAGHDESATSINESLCRIGAKQ